MSGLLQDAEQDFSNQSGDQSGNQSQSSDQSSGSSSGGGLMKDVETGGKDVAVDQGKLTMGPFYAQPLTCYLTEVNSFANKEDIPAGADGLIDQEVNKEI